MDKALESKGILKINDASPNNSLVLFVDSIKQMHNAGHQTYTFPVKQTAIYDVSFRNLVIDVYSNTVSALLITYTPDATFIRNQQKAIKVPFSGKVHTDVFDLYSAGTMQILSTRLKPTLQQICLTAVVYGGSVAIPCTGPAHDPPGSSNCL